MNGPATRTVFLFIVRLVIEVIKGGLGSDRGFYFLLPGDASLPPLAVELLRRVLTNHGFGRIAWNPPLGFQVFLSAAFSFSPETAPSSACHLSQMTSISAYYWRWT